MTVLPEIRIRSLWPRRIARALGTLAALGLAVGVWTTRGSWSPTARRAGKAAAGRLAAEMRPVLQEAGERLATPPEDPVAGYPAAGRLKPPRLPARPAAVLLDPPRGAPSPQPLKARGIAMEEEIRPPVGGPVLLTPPDREPAFWKTAGGVILGAAALAAVFGFWAWHRSPPRSKTLT